jgi:long-chain fatty acid transport protein
MKTETWMHAVRTAVAGTLVAAAGSAHASGFALLEQSASRLGTAFAGTGAAADDATTIFFNPAGLTRLDEAQIVVIPSFIGIKTEFRNDASLPALGQPLGGEGGDAGDWNFVPSAYASLPLGDRLALGIGFNAPFGLKTEYDADWIGRFQAIKSEIKTININPTLAYRLNDAVSIGIGVNYQRLDAELTNAVNYTAVIAQAVGGDPLVVGANLGLEGRAHIEGDDDGWGFNVGVLFEFGDTRIGLAYRSSIDYKIKGTAEFSPPTATDPTGAFVIAQVSGPNGQLTSGPASVDLEVPDFATLSVRQAIGDRFELLADIAWTGWSSVQELRIVRPSGATLSVTPEHWDDSWRFALGGTYAVTPSLKLRAGVAYDETPVPNATRTPRLPDPDRTWIAIGAHWQASEMLRMDFGYAHLFSDDAPLNENAGNTNASGFLIGHQKSSVDIVSLQVTIAFGG